MAEAFTILPEFEYVEEEAYKTIQTPFDLGYVQTRAVFVRPKRKFTLRWNNAPLSDKEYAVGFFRETLGPAGTFSYTPQDPISPPFLPGSFGAVPQLVGSYAERTYYYQLSWVTTTGETVPSAEKSTLITAGNLFTLTIPTIPFNVVFGRVYIGTASGSETLQVEIRTSRGTYREPDITPGSNGLLAGDSPVTANTAKENIDVKLMEDSFQWAKTSPVAYSMVMVFEEIFL